MATQPAPSAFELPDVSCPHCAYLVERSRLARGENLCDRCQKSFEAFCFEPVREGDFLVAVEGREITTAREPYAWFEGLADRAVRLTVTSGARGAPTLDVVVVPTGDELRSRYLDWLERNRKAVEAASGGRVGYLHLPDTYTVAAEMFPQYWYGQTQKAGLIVDGRFNGGGLDPDPFLNRMNLPTLFYPF